MQMPVELMFLKIMLDGRRGRAHRLQRAGERGASAVEWVVITAILVGIAIVLGRLIQTKIMGKANSINLDG